MENSTLYELLKELEIPVAYDHFDDDKNICPPFLVYRETPPDVFSADNINYKNFDNHEIELVTDKKDVKLERKVSDLLTNNKILYEKTDEIWDKDERIFHIFFKI